MWYLSASAFCGKLARPGYTTFVTFGCVSSHDAIFIALSDCLMIRMGIVLHVARMLPATCGLMML